MNGKNMVKPHAKRHGWLKNYNPPGDFSTAPKCGAKTRKGTSCMAPAMKNGRCRMHGGKSTGPKTPEGIEKIREAQLKHGKYTKEALVERKEFNSLLRKLRGTINELNDEYRNITFKI